jgi:RNA polymerase sigma factor (sigma-70 family)
VPVDRGVEDLLRDLAPQVLGALVRRYGHFDTAEDAVQEALLGAAVQWPEEGLPDSPRAWLIRVASRRMTDLMRSEQARTRREGEVAARVLSEDYLAPAADTRPAADQDDTLLLLFLCCHPALTPASQIALTLRAVGGLTTGEIAQAFLVPEATMGQRISRAKQRIKAAGGRFRGPSAHDREARLGAVLRVLYLIFNEGYTASSGTELQRAELSGEAIRLTRMLHRIAPGDAEVVGLLALMLLTDARREARTGPSGELVSLAEQDRTLWDAGAIAEGVALVTDAVSRTGQGPYALGPYQLQAAIAAVHDEAASVEDTDWPEILALYGLLDRASDNPVVRLNHAVAVAMVHGPLAGLAFLDGLDEDSRMLGHHRLDAVRAHLLEMAGEPGAAIAHYRAAARRTTSIPERHYLEARIARLENGFTPGSADT